MRARQEFFRAPQREIEAAQRRAAVAGNKSCRIEPRKHIALALQHQQAHQRLDAGHVDPAGLELVFVVQGDIAQDSRTG